jgi:hypothetical protein
MSMEGMIVAEVLMSLSVAVAKLTIKQNPICLWWLWRYMRGSRTTKGVLGSCSNPRMLPYWAQLDT